MTAAFLFLLLSSLAHGADDLDATRAALQAQLDAVDEQIAARDGGEPVEHVLRPVGTIIEGVAGANVVQLTDFVNGNGAAWASACLTDVTGAPFTVSFSLAAGTPIGFLIRATNTTVDEETRSCLASAVQQSAESESGLPRSGKVTFLIQ